MEEDYLESLFDLIFAQHSIGASINDDQKKFIRVNKRFCEMIGYNEEELIGKSPLDFTLDEDLEISRAYHQDMMNPNANNGAYEKRYRKKDGSILWVKIITKTIRDPKNKTQSISFALIEDITIHKEIKAQADFNQIQLNAILETAILGVLCVNSQWQVTYSNGSFQKMLGYSELQLLSKNLRELTHPEDLTETNIKFDQTKPGQSYQAYRRYKKSDGSYLWCRLNVTKFPQSNSNFYGLAIVEDVSKEKEAEKIIQTQQAKLITSAKMSALGEMAGGIAHEINNPLTIILGKLHQIERLIKDPELNSNKINENIQIAQETAVRISKIIQGLQTFSRDGDNDQFVNISLNSILKSTRALCQERFNAHGILLSIQNDLEDDVVIKCKQSQIIQALISILSNSFDAVESLESKWVNVVVTKSHEKILLVITDSGKGISAAIAEKMLMPFFSTKSSAKGTGLGLSTAAAIIEEHYGKLTLDKNCENTRFIIELPTVEL